MTDLFTGTGVALVTPFHADGTIDFQALGRVIDHCIEGGVEYLVSIGTTGESVTLDADEQRSIIAYTAERIDGRVPLVAGFGGSDTRALVRHLRSADLTGVHGILSSGPSYNKPTQDGLFAHYMAVAEATSLPIILYNVPGRSAKNMTAETTLRLAHEVDHIVGIKEASGDMAQVMAIADGRPAGFKLISGDDLLTLPYLAVGFDGVISVIAQATPGHFSDMVRAGLAGDFAAARDLHYRLMPLMDALFAENNPGGIKAALKALDLCEEHMRLPLVPVGDGNRRAVIEALRGVD